MIPTYPGFQQVDVSFLVKLSHVIDFDIYLKKSDQKLARLELANLAVKEVLQSYLGRGVQVVYIRDEDYQKLSRTLTKILAQQKITKDESSPPEKKVDELESSTEVFKKIFDKFDMTQETFELATKITKSTIQTVKNIKDLKQFYLNFKSNCSKEFLELLLTNYFSLSVIETFSWNSESIQEKCSLGILFSDITLDPQDFMEMRKLNDDSQKLPQTILDHPERVVSILKASKDPINVSTETYAIILQHHERQDGSGYPKGLNATQIHILSAIFIVCRKFVEKMMALNFDSSIINEVIEEINREYNEGSFKTALKGLRESLSIEKNTVNL
jgi:hypothetical protein